MGKSIVTLRKENLFLKELTDEELAEFKRSSERYEKDPEFKYAIDKEIDYRFKSKVVQQ